MAIVVCMMEDCKYRSKRKLRNYKINGNIPCYGCTLDAVTVAKIFDPDGDVEAVTGKKNTAVCINYQPKDRFAN